MTEPWMSGSHAEVDPRIRPLLHAFDHALIDMDHWTAGLTTEQLWARPMELGAIGFHIRHITGSTDRLFAYAEGNQLSEAQMQELRSEMEPGASLEDLLASMRRTFGEIAAKVQAIDPATLPEPRFIGRKRLPTTLAGLLVHISEHTMRHVGEAIVTIKVVKATS